MERNDLRKLVFSEWNYNFQSYPYVGWKPCSPQVCICGWHSLKFLHLCKNLKCTNLFVDHVNPTECHVDFHTHSTKGILSSLLLHPPDSMRRGLASVCQLQWKHLHNLKYIKMNTPFAVASWLLQAYLHCYVVLWYILPSPCLLFNGKLLRNFGRYFPGFSPLATLLLLKIKLAANPQW